MSPKIPKWGVLANRLRTILTNSREFILRNCLTSEDIFINPAPESDAQLAKKESTLSELSESVRET